jgi:hypothetical protein
MDRDAERVRLVTRTEAFKSMVSTIFGSLNDKRRMLLAIFFQVSWGTHAYARHQPYAPKREDNQSPAEPITPSPTDLAVGESLLRITRSRMPDMKHDE